MTDIGHALIGQLNVYEGMASIHENLIEISVPMQYGAGLFQQRAVEYFGSVSEFCI